MLNSTLSELSEALKAKKISSAELTRQYLDRIGRLNGELNAFITVDHDRALADAKRADQKIAKGVSAPLTGIPVAHKDIFCTRGVLTTCGSRMLADFKSPYDAHVIEQFSGAGAVLLGKCNMDEFAMGSSNETSHFGPVRNPWGKKRVPGGSSGGSATAVAARMAPAATGTDTGGSIRDSTSLERPKEDYSRSLNQEVKDLRIGLPQEYFGDGVEPGVRRAVEEALRWFESLGAKRVPMALPNTKLAVPVYYVIAPAEASSNLSRFDGVRYGHRAKDYADLGDMYCRTRGEGFGAEVKRRILVGTYVLSHGYYDAYYLQAQKIRRLIARDFAAAFERCDLILGPTSPTTAFAIGAKTDDPVQMYLNDIFTIPAPLAGLPALSIPCGFDEKGLPVGLQLTGDYFSEARLLGAAHRYQRATDWHLRVPTETPL